MLWIAIVFSVQAERDRDHEGNELYREVDLAMSEKGGTAKWKVINCTIRGKNKAHLSYITL